MSVEDPRELLRAVQRGPKEVMVGAGADSCDGWVQVVCDCSHAPLSRCQHYEFTQTPNPGDTHTRKRFVPRQELSVVWSSLEHVFDTTTRIADLDADAACEAIASTQQELREREWRELALAAHWADLHDARTLPVRTGPVLPGTERAKQMGGHGTPEVAEFACAELGLVMGTGFIAANHLMRDALDLRHRHPQMWAALRTGQGRVWKARKVARLAHAAGLTLEQAHSVDAQTTPYVDTLTWAKFLDLVEARIIEADPAAAEERRVAREMERFVATGQSNEYGLKTLVARAQAGEVIFFVAMCDRIAQILLLDGDTDPVDVRRSKAVGILAHPARALALLAGHATGARPVEPGPRLVEPVETGTGAGIDPDRMRPRAVLYVRISEQALRTGAGVAQCENAGVGAVTVGQVRDFLGHCHVTVRPVLDLRDQVPVDAYEVPDAMRETLRLARPSSVFPFSHTSSHRPDWDHTAPYVPVAAGGPAGQTRMENLGPMIRFGHRVKTHGRGWVHRQPRPGVYLWRTPHGYWFRVDNQGTHALGRDPDLSGYDAPERPATTLPRTPYERALAELVAA